jgi:hypothetical protein
MTVGVGAFLLLVAFIVLLVHYLTKPRRVRKEADPGSAETHATAGVQSAGVPPAEPRGPPNFGPILPPANDVEPLVREFGDTVAGVSFANYDGKSRQEIISRAVKPGMQLVLRPELNNSVVPSFLPSWHPTENAPVKHRSGSELLVCHPLFKLRNNRETTP